MSMHVIWYCDIKQPWVEYNLVSLGKGGAK